MPAHHAPRAGIAPGGQVAPAPAYQRQVGDVSDPHLVGVRGRGLAQRPVLGYDSGRVGLRGMRALGSGAERALPAGPQPVAQRVAPHRVALGLQLDSQAAGAIPPGMARKRLLRGRLPAGNWRRASRHW